MDDLSARIPASPNRRPEPESAAKPGILRFGVFELDLATGELRKAGRKVRIQDQPLAVLVTLLERPGELVTREELRQKVWQADTFVDFEAGLNKAITKVREVLSDSAVSPRFIETLPRRGYRFIAPVEKLPAELEVSPAPPASSVVPAAPASPVAPEVPPLKTPSRRAKRLQLLIVGGASVLLLVAAALWLLYSRIHHPPAIQSIAVLPLENLSGDPNQEYFADGMTDELITDLAQIHSLRVISRTSVTQFRHARKPLPEIAAELRVDAVIEGSVLRSGDNVRVTAQLLDARQDRHLWAASYNRPASDLIALQNEVAKAIADQVRVKLTPEEGARLSRAHPLNASAYDALLKGRFLWNRRNPADAEQAIAYFRQAIREDGGSAEAWAALAGCETSLGADIGATDPAATAAQARFAVSKALQLDPNLAEAHNTLANIKLWYDWDWVGSEQEFRRALALNPNSSMAHLDYSHLLQIRKRFSEALDENRRALDLAPLDILGSMHLAWLYSDARDGTNTVAQSRRVLELDPRFAGAYLFLASGYELQKKWPEAIASYEQVRKLYPADVLSGIARVSAESGDRKRAARAFAELSDFAKRNYVAPTYFAQYYAALGDRDRAFEWLETAYRRHAPSLISLEVSSHWDALRTDKRFHSLEQQIGF